MMSMRSLLWLALMLAAGCRGADVNVRNLSSTRLENVTISANGAAANIDRIEPGADGRTSLCPRGEAGSADVSFRANGREHRRQLELYFECDPLYRLQFDVSSDLDVTASLR